MATLAPGRRKLLQEIKELQFAVTELVLYLDTNPEDEKALKQHRKYSRQLHRALNKYQDRYTMLVNEYADSDFPWEWIEEPWPWQINY